MTKNEKTYPELLRLELEYLNSKDGDRATRRNDVGFNKYDGDRARKLLEKKEWNESDIKRAFRILSHYSGTQLSDQWETILEAKKKFYGDREQKPKVDPEMSEDTLIFELDPNNKVYLLSGGQFYLSRFMGMDENSGLEKWSEELKFAAPLQIKSLIKFGNKWLIHYFFDNEERKDTIDTMLSLLSNKLKFDTTTSKLFAQFLYKFKTKKETDKDFEIEHEPVTVVDGIVTVNKTTEQPTSDILKALIEIHKVATFPDSFLTTLCYNLLAPFSYEIRSEGQKFPYRLLAGKSHGGKTSEQVLLTLKGFDQKIKDRKETLNTIKTIFTFGQQVERSRIPFAVDDINNEWLKTHSEELKGSTDSVKFMARGTKAQTQNVWEMWGMPEFTMNEEPGVPVALMDRLIISHFTAENSERQNKGEYERLSDQLKPGFMLNLIKETLQGTKISDIIKNIHKSVKNDAEINQRIIDHAHSLLSDLAKKYSLTFPEKPKVEGQSETDLLEQFCTFVATRFRAYDKDGTNHLKFYKRIPKNGEEKEEMLITSEGYKDFLKEYKPRGLGTMIDFINEMKKPDIKIEPRWIPKLGKTAKCIILPLNLIEEEYEEMESVVEIDDSLF